MNLWIDSWNSVSSSRSTYIFNARISGASAKRPSARAVPFTFPSRSQGPSGQSRRCSLSSIRQPQKDASCCSRLCSPESPWHPWSVVTSLGAVFRMPVEAGPRPRGNCLLLRHARSEGASRRVASWEAGSVVTGPGPAARECSWPCPQDPKKALAAPSTWLPISHTRGLEEAERSLSRSLP